MNLTLQLLAAPPASALFHSRPLPEPLFAQGRLLDPIQLHTPIRLREASGREVRTPPVLRFGSGWCVTTHGTYAVWLSPDPTAKGTRRKEWIPGEGGGPSWPRAEEIVRGFRRVKAQGRRVSLHLKEALGLGEFVTRGFLNQLDHHARQAAARASGGQAEIRTALLQALSVPLLHPPSRLLDTEPLAAPLLLRRSLALVSPPSTEGETAKAARLEVDVLFLGHELLYARRDEFAFQESDYRRSEAWLEERLARAQETEAGL